MSVRGQNREVGRTSQSREEIPLILMFPLPSGSRYLLQRVNIKLKGNRGYHTPASSSVSSSSLTEGRAIGRAGRGVTRAVLLLSITGSSSLSASVAVGPLLNWSPDKVSDAGSFVSAPSTLPWSVGPLSLKGLWFSVREAKIMIYQHLDEDYFVDGVSSIVTVCLCALTLLP